MNLLAALIFFTRLPFWRLKEVPSACFKRVVPYWPLVGWLTGGIMAGTLWLAAQVMPITIAWIVAIVSRLLVTGCLHEDGLADFFDGFGGGTSRERILAIMKDSHIGTYGVIALIIYFLLMMQLACLPLLQLCIMVFCGDSLGKLIASQLINVMPYARKEAESKAKVVYNRMNGYERVINLMGGLLPAWLLLPSHLWICCIAPIALFVLLVRLMKRRLQGYTGDCCGATFLLCELAFYLCFISSYRCCCY